MNAKKALASIVVTLGMAAVGTAYAQTPPAGSTGECKDNTYTSSASKRGACKGHGGVKEWYATEKESKSAKSSSAESKTKTETPPATTAAAPAATPAAKPATTKTAASTMPAPGGGAGKVWVNTSTHVYHCQGTKWYGKTKEGEYMTEAEAKAKGAHADHGKACG